jgi:hypothetical protein
MQSQRQPEYYVAMVPKQYTESDLDRHKKLLELGDPSFFGGNFSSCSNKLPTTSTSTESVKLKSAAVQVHEQTNRTRLAKLLELGDVNLFGSGTSPTAELLARRQR